MSQKLINWLLLKLIFVIVISRESSSECRSSYFTFCDNLNDLNTLDNKEFITELVVGHEDEQDNKLFSFNMNTLDFDDYETLTTLVFVNQFNNIETYGISLEPLRSRLKNLFFYKNKLLRLRDSAIENVVLHKLSFVNNQIEYLHRNVFYNCEIEILDFSENNLEAIEKQVFFTEDSPGNATRQLILKQNKISSIEPNSLPLNLEILNLDYNQLQYIHHDVFKDLVNLKELRLSHNRLSSPPYIAPLKQIEIFDFSFNKMVNIDGKQFVDLKYLEIVDFSNNLLSYPCILHFFKATAIHPSLQISLAFNRLTYLNTTNFEEFKNNILVLYGNPWNCECWNNIERFIFNEKFKRNPCDVQHFNNGVTPYCLSYSTKNSTLCEGCKWGKDPYEQSDLEHFVKVIEQSRKDVKCSLKLRRK